MTAVARHGAVIQLDNSPHTKDRVQKSRDVIVEKVNSQASVYGVSTGFGGSGKADTLGCPVLLPFLC